MLQQSTQLGSHEPLITLRQVVKTFQVGPRKYAALDGISMTVHCGEYLAVVGKSGSGKSTLLNIITGIDRPTSGEVVIGGKAVHQLTENAAAIWRGRSVGVVFQFFQLLPTLTVLENIMLPMDFCSLIPARQRKTRALQLLEQVGVSTHAYKLPNALSGGEQQRVAIARALANDPPILVADEPTGNLDSTTTHTIFELLRMLTTSGKTVVMVTHEHDISHWATRSITLADGKIIDNVSNSAVNGQINEAVYVQPTVV